MTIQEEIVTWLHTRPDWQQEAALRILTKGSLGETDISDLVSLCKTKEGQKATNFRKFPILSSETAKEKEFRLSSIGAICGIENLAPRKPLSFGGGNLTVIYGNNGSGKSGFTRILKRVCGKPHATDLRPNVYDIPPTKRCCKIQFSAGGEEHSVDWLATDEPIQDLLSVDIFDADCGRFYLSKESEASYIPPVVVLFDELVQACTAVKQQLETELHNLPSLLPANPAELEETPAIRKFRNLKSTNDETFLADILTWKNDDKDALQILEERLKATDPVKLASQKRSQKIQLDNLISNLDNAVKISSPDACQSSVKLKIEAKKQRDISIDGAKATLGSANLEGIGSDTWRTLWETARHYSESTAYPGHSFPHIDTGTHCVLCHQPLSPSAKERLNDFEQFIRGDLEKAAQIAEKARDMALTARPQPPSEKELTTVCQAAGLEAEEWLPRLLEAWVVVSAISQSLKELENYKIPQGIAADNFPWIEELRELGRRLEEQAVQHEKDAASFDREKALQQKKELLAKKWTSEQGKSIRTEILRLQKADQLNKQIKSTNPKAISLQAGTVSEKLITETYIKRFNEELKNLGAKKIKVELIKTRTSRGKTLHAIRLRGTKDDDVNPIEILSDGERRIVELAAFLADVTGKTTKSPFIFDDPISSLDQDYEEKTIDRLIALSENRQVLVFTHRLSFLGILNDKATTETICIRHEPWGAGEPGDVPLFGKNPDKALKKLRDERLPQAKKSLLSDGNEAYYPLAKAICSDLRILVERIVELVFLADIVQRHRRAVNTDGKIYKLAKIKPEDCALVDKYMGKYSCYEHSQSYESPVEVPEPDELTADIEALLTWHDEFIKRKN